MIDLGIGWRATDQSAIHRAIAIGKLATDLANGNRGFDRGNTGENPIQVTTEQTVLRSSHPTQLVFRRLLTANNDRRRAKRLDLFLNLVAGALADRGQHDHRPHADHDPEHGQDRPQRVQQQTLDSEIPGPKPKHRSIRVSWLLLLQEL